MEFACRQIEQDRLPPPPADPGHTVIQTQQNADGEQAQPGEDAVHLTCIDLLALFVELLLDGGGRILFAGLGHLWIGL